MCLASMPSSWGCRSPGPEGQPYAASVVLALQPPASDAGACAAACACDSVALPFPAASLDLVLMPHTLEHSPDPHQTLREVERVLVPEGRVVITGFNPDQPVGLSAKTRACCVGWVWVRCTCPIAASSSVIGVCATGCACWALRSSWQRLACYRPAVTHGGWLRRFSWMDKAGPRWWSILERRIAWWPSSACGCNG